MIKKFLKNQLYVFAVASILIFGGSLLFAAPPDSPYGPGDTLDPNCAPGEPNCSVTIGADFSARDSDDLEEGLVNLYYTSDRVSNQIDVLANTTARHNPVTLSGANYLSLSGQTLTAGTIDISSHTNLGTGSGLLLTNNTLSVSGLSSGNFTTSNVSQWTNDSGYITSYTETDPVFTASAASGITGGNITNWNSAFGWGNHALGGYYGPSNPIRLSYVEEGSFTTNYTTPAGNNSTYDNWEARVTATGPGAFQYIKHSGGSSPELYRLNIYEANGSWVKGALISSTVGVSSEVINTVNHVVFEANFNFLAGQNYIFEMPRATASSRSFILATDAETADATHVLGPINMVRQRGPFSSTYSLGWQFYNSDNIPKGVVGPLDEADLPGYGLATAGQVLARTANGAEFVNISTGNFTTSNVSQWTNDAGYVSNLSSFDATNLSIVDSANYFTATTVETALAELFSSDSNAFSLLNKPRLSAVDAVVVQDDRTNSWDALGLNTYMVARINAVENTPFSSVQVKVRAQGANSTQLSLKIYEADEAWVQGDLLVDVNSNIYDGSLVDPYWATFNFPEITPVTGANYIFRVDPGPNWSYTYFLPYRSTSSATGSNNTLMGDYNIIQMSIWINGTSQAGYAWGLRLGTSALPKGVVGTLDPVDLPGYGLATTGQVLARTVGGVGFVDSTYLNLTDTPAGFTANAIPYTNSAGNALLHSPGFTYNGVGLLSVNSTRAVYIPGGNFTGTLVVGDGGQSLSYVAGNDGRFNTFVGLGAGFANTTGYDNAALGYEALRLNTTGYDNTAVGRGALRSNTTGFYNTASGRNALVSNNEGAFNTASGYRALFSNTTGNFNTASGANALFFNTTGSYNTASGVSALEYNTTGTNNTASGYNALLFNTTGTNNTASGFSALLTNSTGINNTATGANALFHLSTGAENTALGFQAGRYVGSGTVQNQTSNFSVYLGNNTRAGTSGNTNEIVIGYNAIGSGSNTVTLGNTSITETVLRGNVSIGPTIASYKLHVSIAGTGSVAGFTNDNGTCTIDPNTSSLSCSSDSRLKTEVLSVKRQTDVGSSLARLSQLNPISYRWNNEEGTDAPMRYGLIAQEVQKVFPELVSEGPLLDPLNPNLGNTLSVSYGGFTPFMIDAISELNEKIDFLSSLSLGASQIDLEAKGSLSEIIIQALKNAVLHVRELVTGKIITSELCIDDICFTAEEAQKVKELLGEDKKVEIVEPQSETPIEAPEETSGETEEGGVVDGGAGIQEESAIPSTEATIDEEESPSEEEITSDEPIIS